MTRSRQPRASKDRILVVGDGDTEGNYFNGIRSDLHSQSGVVLKVKKGKGGCATDTVRIAINAMNAADSGSVAEFDEVYCIVDVEGAGANHQSNLNDAIKLADDEGICIVLSNPCFECWLLAHFDRISRPFGSCEDVIKQLSKYWREKFGCDYEKADKNIYDKVANLTPAAIDNARTVVKKDHPRKPRLDCNSSTEVYRLVERLLSGNTQARPTP